MEMKEVAGSEFELKADLVLLAMGFTGPVLPGLIDQTRATLDHARQRRGDHHRLQDVCRQDLHVWRHASRPVAGRVGHPRRPSVRARRR
jgi:NADPH-dependent glutamate synthase beta subunit-like oxidoreductase